MVCAAEGKGTGEERLLSVFREWDASSGGLIREADLRRVLVAVGVSEADIPLMLTSADASKDGQINYKALLSWLHSPPAAVREPAADPASNGVPERPQGLRDRGSPPPMVSHPGTEEHLRKLGLWPLPQAIHVLQSRTLTCLFSVIRDAKTEQVRYVEHSDRLMRILAEEGLARLPTVHPVDVETPCGTYGGLAYGTDNSDLCCVSIVRSGDTLLEAVRRVCPGVAVGHVLVQRDESDPEKRAVYFYHKFPPDMQHRTVILADPMLGTGGSACAAIRCLLDAGVKEERILFLNVVSCPEGLKKLTDMHPSVTIVTAALDPKMDEHKYIVPGLGDFGDRYYNTGDFCKSRWQTPGESVCEKNRF